MDGPRNTRGRSRYRETCRIGCVAVSVVAPGPGSGPGTNHQPFIQHPNYQCVRGCRGNMRRNVRAERKERRYQRKLHRRLRIHRPWSSATDDHDGSFMDQHIRESDGGESGSGNMRPSLRPRQRPECPACLVWHDQNGEDSSDTFDEDEDLFDDFDDEFDNSSGREEDAGLANANANANVNVNMKVNVVLNRGDMELENAEEGAGQELSEDDCYALLVKHRWTQSGFRKLFGILVGEEPVVCSKEIRKRARKRLKKKKLARMQRQQQSELAKSQSIDYPKRTNRSRNRSRSASIENGKRRDRIVINEDYLSSSSWSSTCSLSAPRLKSETVYSSSSSLLSSPSVSLSPAPATEPYLSLGTTSIPLATDTLATLAHMRPDGLWMREGMDLASDSIGDDSDVAHQDVFRSEDDITSILHNCTLKELELFCTSFDEVWNHKDIPQEWKTCIKEMAQNNYKELLYFEALEELHYRKRAVLAPQDILSRSRWTLFHKLVDRPGDLVNTAVEEFSFDTGIPFNVIHTVSSGGYKSGEVSPSVREQKLDHRESCSLKFVKRLSIMQGIQDIERERARGGQPLRMFGFYVDRGLWNRQDRLGFAETPAHERKHLEGFSDCLDKRTSALSPPEWKSKEHANMDDEDHKDDKNHEDTEGDCDTEPDVENQVRRIASKESGLRASSRLCPDHRAPANLPKLPQLPKLDNQTDLSSFLAQNHAWIPTANSCGIDANGTSTIKNISSVTPPSVEHLRRRDIQALWSPNAALSDSAREVNMVPHAFQQLHPYLESPNYVAFKWVPLSQLSQFWFPSRIRRHLHLHQR